MQTLLINRNSRPYLGCLGAAVQMGLQMDAHTTLGKRDSDRLFAITFDTFVEQLRPTAKHEHRSKPGKGAVDTR